MIEPIETCRRLLVLLGCLLALAACSKFDSPPQASLPAAAEGVLSDPSAPLVVEFHEAIVSSSLTLKVIRYETDEEGRLADESGGELEILFQTDPIDGDVGGIGVLDPSRRVYTITLQQTFPIGPDLAVVIEPGLADDQGNEWQVRQTLIFGFQFECGDDTGSEVFGDGVYFFKVEVEEPIAVQIQLFADIDVDEDSGNFIGQFTNADRNPDLDCGLSCEDNEVCRTLPAPQCVLPSEQIGSTDEFPDYIPNKTPPTGYSFAIGGCVKDQEDGSVAFAHAPADVVVQSPPVTVKAINLSAGFDFDDEGVFRGEGTFTAAEVFLGTTSSGSGSGTHSIRLIPADETPPGIPTPPAE